MDQHDRDSVIHDFKAGNVRVLVATSVAARGLDVKALRLVVNYDSPSHYEDYVHRVGRTGRAGMKGIPLNSKSRDSVILQCERSDVIVVVGKTGCCICDGQEGGGHVKVLMHML